MANNKENVNKTSSEVKQSEPATEVKKPIAKTTAAKTTKPAATKTTAKTATKTTATKTTKPAAKPEAKEEVKAEVKANETTVKTEVKPAEVVEKTPTEAKGETLLEVKNLCQYFPVERNFFGKPIKFLKAVDGVSFSLQKGKTLGIVGESGCGKTTMGRTILRLYDVTSGEVWFKGQKVSDLKNKEFDKLRPNMQMIFQDPYASLSPRLTVGEIIGEAALQHGIVSKADYHDYVLSVMKMCGLQPHYFERYPHEFSGGQRQRICIARALALKPELVICDEPVSALDVSIQAQIINMLIELRKTLGLTYVFISHDLSVVKHISDQVGVMYLGTMVEYGSKNDIFEHTLHPYTKALFSAVPVPNPHVKMNRIILKGDIPSPVNPPKGCKFHTRCEKCMEICTRISPEYREIEEGHFCACHLYNTPEVEKALEEKYVEEQKLAEEKEANKNAVEKFAESCKHKADDCKKKIISAFKKRPKEEAKSQEDTTKNVDVK
jgi:peptide/nickel transport system ATP-binding protein